MLNSSMAADIIRYGQRIAYLGVNTLNTGFLTKEVRNSISKEEASNLVQCAELVVRQMIDQMVLNNVELSEYEVCTLFQYIFDKVVEVTYKTINGNDIDDVIICVTEAFEYHEPDLPYYIQQKINVVISQTATISSSTLNYIEQNCGSEGNYKDWLLPYLLLAVSLAIEFVLEMDLDDDSELQDYLGGDL